MNYFLRCLSVVLFIFTAKASSPALIITNTGLITHNAAWPVTQQSQISPTICAGSTVAIIAYNTSNLASPNYSIVPNYIANATGTFVVTPSVTTNFTIYTTGLNSSNSVVTETSATTIYVNPQPTLAPTFTQATCTNANTSVNLHLAFNPPTPVPNYALNWSPVPLHLVSNMATTVSPIEPGNYTVTAFAAGGCSVSTQFIIYPQPEPANFTFIPAGPVYSITCAQPTVNIFAINGALSYTWHNGSSPVVTTDMAVMTMSTLGVWTVQAQNPVSNCMTTHTLMVTQNTVAPTSAISPTLQNITCLTGVVTVTSIASPANVSQYFTYNTGLGTFTTTVNSATTVISPPVGSHAVCVVNNLNGCSTCKGFSVVTSDNFPLLMVTSPENFTIGCSTHSVTHISLSGNTTPYPPGGGSIGYALASPAFTGTNYAFSTQSAFNVTAPGTWTAVVKDNNNQCQTKISFSIIQNIAGPDIHASNPHTILNCDTMSTILTAVTNNTNVGFSWYFPGPAGPIVVLNPTVAATTSSNTTSPLAGNYTLSLTDNGNGCISQLVVPVEQNLFRPSAYISGGLTFSLTCTSPTVQLTNNSTHNPQMASAGFPTNLPVIGSLWEGPSPQLPLQLSGVYLAATPGQYTLTARDLNNGCTSHTTTNVMDNRIYPVIDNQGPFYICGQPSFTISTQHMPFYSYQWATDPLIVSNPNTNSIVVTGQGVFQLIVTNTVSTCSTVSNFYVLGCVGFASNAAINDNIRIFPNPGSGLITLHFENPVKNSSVEIYNTLGTIVHKQTATTRDTPIDLQNQPDGIYFISVITDEKVMYTSKIIKQ